MFSSVKKFLFKITLIAGLSLFLSLSAQNISAPSQQPITNFILPMFGEDGYKSWDISGKEGFYINPREILIKGMLLRICKAGSPSEFETQITSAEARIHVDEKVAHGPKELHIEGTNFNVTGKDWH